MATTDSLFWSWLAGFIDGEGCFTLTVSASQTFVIRCSIALRADDWPVLRRIQEQTGVGTLRISANQSPANRPNSNAAVRWSTQTIDECLVLRDGLASVGGLRAKKSSDFALWGQALDLIDQQGGGRHSGAWATLMALKQKLHQVKRYDPALAEGFLEKLGRNADGVLTANRSHGGRGSSEFWQSEASAPNRQWRQLRYAKLSQEQIDEITKRIDAGERRSLIAKEFGVSVGLLAKFTRGDYLRRDGTLQRDAPKEVVPATSPEFWETEAGQRAKRSNAALRGKISQEKIDELVMRAERGESKHKLAAEYGVSRPLILKFVRGNYIRRD